MDNVPEIEEDGGSGGIESADADGEEDGGDQEGRRETRNGNDDDRRESEKATPTKNNMKKLLDIKP